MSSALHVLQNRRRNSLLDQWDRSSCYICEKCRWSAGGWWLVALPVMCVLVRRLRHVFQTVFHFPNKAFDHPRQCPGFSLVAMFVHFISEVMSSCTSFVRAMNVKAVNRRQHRLH